MSSVLPELVDQYAGLLQSYIREPTEALRDRVSQLGHEAIARGLGVLDVALVHREALARVLAQTRTSEESQQTLRRASEFLLESMVAFEMTHRGYQETIQKLIGANEALRRSEAKDRAVLNAMPDSMFRIDREGTYLDFHAGRNGALGIPPDEVVGKKVTEVLPADLAQQLIDRVKLTLVSGTVQVFEFQVMGHQYRRDYEARLAVSGKDEVLGIVRDITERKRAEEEHARLIREQAARLEAQAAQERISKILESITDGFFALDGQWRYTYVNQQAELILRKAREDLLGKNIWEETPETIGSAFDREFHRAAAERVTVRFREFFSPLGAWFEVHAYPAPEGLSVYFRDVTQQRHHEQARLGLARLAQRIAVASSTDEALVVAAAELVASFDVALARIWLWDEAEQMLVLRASGGLSLRNAATGSRFGHLRLGESKIGSIGARQRPLWSNALQQEPWLVDPDWARREGMVAFAGFPLFMGDRLLGVMGLFSRRAFDEDDLAALTTLADHLTVAIEKSRLLARVQAALTLRREFINAAAHELRTPVTILKGYSGLLRRSPEVVSAAYGQALLALEVSAGRVAQLASDLVEADALERGTLSLQAQQFDLADLARQVVEAAREHATYRPHLEATPAPVIGDYERLEQVIQNLLDNAARYQPQPGDIEVRVGVEAGQAVVTVRGQGLAILPERQSHVFEPMYEPIPPGAVGYVGVVGLGLMISKRLIELHGGHIWFESDSAQGNTFHFTLPLAPPQS